MSERDQNLPPKTSRVLEVGRDWTVDRATGCWEWTGYKLKGYGRCTTGQAHREVWRQSGRLLSKSDDLHHRCHNPGCVNPDHMEPLPRVAHLVMHKQADSALEWADINEMRQLVGEFTIYEIGERFGLGKSQVHRILINEDWHDPEYVPGFLVDCEECGEEFRSTKVNKRFCSVPCRRRWHVRRMNRRKRGEDPDAPFVRRAA